MGKKKIIMKLPFISQSKLSSSPPWPFPICGDIKTLSFRKAKNDTFRTFNSTFLNDSQEITITSSSRSFSTLFEDLQDPLETLINGLKYDNRLFFEPSRSSSVLFCEHKPEPEPEPEVEKDEVKKVVAYKESELLPIESNNPYEDFRRSMEEMVEAHGLKDWQGLEELLGCYLEINCKNNHEYIVGAFIGLLVSFSFGCSDASTSSTSTSTNTTTCSSYSNYSSPSSPLSFPSSSLTTSCLSSILDHGDDGHDNDDDNDVNFNQISS